MAHIGHISQLLQCFVSYSGMQKAMQWWEARRSSRLKHEAEQIREGLLQELFAMRRQLELSNGDSAGGSAHSQQWLSQVDRLQQTLERLGYRLSPPYLEESLPLAIQHLIDQWQTDHPLFNVQTYLPLHGFDSSNEVSQIVIAVLNELLQIAVPAHVSSGTIEVSFTQFHKNELRVAIAYPTEAFLTQIQHSLDLQYLKQVFQSLALGQCDYYKQDLTLIWRFYWSLD